MACFHHCFDAAAAVVVVGVADGFGEVAVAVAGEVAAAVAVGIFAVVADAGLVAVTAAAEFSVDDDNCWPCPLPFLNLKHKNTNVDISFTP